MSIHEQPGMMEPNPNYRPDEVPTTLKRLIEERLPAPTKAANDVAVFYSTEDVLAKDRQDLLDSMSPEELIDAFLTKTCGDAYDPASQHMKGTASRFTRMMQELTNGNEEWEFTTFDSDSTELVIMKDILFTSICAHHIAPYSGVCHVGYIPDGRLAGLSKLARQVRSSAHMLGNQEDLTWAIAHTLEDRLEPKGVAVIMKATHSCMTIRGALAHGTATITSCMLGVFATNEHDVKNELLKLLNGSS
jgi:GTP cyclohydrolase I